MSESIAKRQRTDPCDVAVVNKEIEEATSRVEFMDMNDDCLRLVLSELPVNELLKFRAVCSKWNNMIITEIFAPKQSLKLIIKVRDSKYNGNYWRDQCSCDNEKDSNYLEVLDSKEYHSMNSVADELKIYIIKNITFPRAIFCRFLSKFFPKIRKLFISKEEFTIRDNQFLRIWKELTSLTLNVHEMPSGYGTDFCKMINSFTNLSKLNLLVCNFKKQEEDGNISPLAPTLLRLNSFAIKGHSTNSDFLTLLGSKCHQLQLNCSYYDYDRLHSTLMLKPPNQLNVIQSLTHLILADFEHYSTKILALIYENVVNLKYLAIKYRYNGNVNLSSFLPADIVKAKNLQELNLLGVNYMLDYDFLVAPIDYSFNVTSFKRLTLSPYVYDDSKCPYPRRWAERLSSIFPNLEQLILVKKKLSQKDPIFKEELENNRHLFKNLKFLSIE